MVKKNVKSRAVTAKNTTKWNRFPTRAQKKAGGGVAEKTKKPHYWYRNRKVAKLKMKKLGIRQNKGQFGVSLKL